MVIWLFMYLRLWWQGDNTVKELRNSMTGKLASLMTSAGFFNITAHHHLQVGHTHEDVGFLDLPYSPHRWIAHLLVRFDCISLPLVLQMVRWLLWPVRCRRSTSKHPGMWSGHVETCGDSMLWKCHALLIAKTLPMKGSCRNNSLLSLQSMTWSTNAKWWIPCLFQQNWVRITLIILDMVFIIVFFNIAWSYPDQRLFPANLRYEIGTIWCPMWRRSKTHTGIGLQSSDEAEMMLRLMMIMGGPVMSQRREKRFLNPSLFSEEKAEGDWNCFPWFSS